MRFPQLTLCLVALAELAVAYHSNFTSECKDVAFQAPGILSACCLTQNGTDVWYNKSELELALCIGINYETLALEWDLMGKYPNYCNDCSLDGTILQCSCLGLTSGQQAPVTSGLDLNEGIGNVNGTLQCLTF